MIDWKATAPKALPALVTPFDAHGDIDTAAHARNIETLHARGCTGVLIAGSTGEGPFLDPGERGDLVAAAKASVPAMVVMCGVNAESNRQAERQIAEAAAAGADAVLVITPTTLSRGKPVVVERFYASLAATAAVPVFVYNVPPVTGWDLPMEIVESLARHPNVFGMKDSSGKVEHLDEIAEPIDAGFVAYAGASRALLDSGRKGAHGAITASANYAFDDVLGAVTADQDAQDRLTAVSAIVERHGVPGTKLAARLCGLETGSPRAPLTDVDPDAAADIVSALQAGGLL